jgi:predicted NACHT family NTPase
MKMNQIIQWVRDNPAVSIALIGVLGTILGGFLTTIVWPLLKTGLESLWDKITARISGKSFENRFLDWIIKEQRYLPILPTTLVPVTEKKIHELDQLYVSLAIQQNPQKTQGIDISKVLSSYPNAVILGEPGAGKTTMLRFLALTFARARRNRPLAETAPERQKERARIRDARRRVRHEFGCSNYPFPIFVYLNRLKDVASWGSGKSILDALREEWKSIDTLRDFPENFLEKKLQKGQCIFLFDAFDELGSQSARNEVARHIGKLVAAAPPGNRFLVTSRIVGYAGQLNELGFHVVTIQRLSLPLIKELVEKWFDSLEETRLATQLIDTLKANPRIYDLAVNPMLLSLIVLVQYIRRLIPDRRHVLYDECVKILVERRYAPPHVQAEYNETLPGEEAIALLREVALALQLKHVRDIPRRELEHHLIPDMMERMPSSRAASVDPALVLQNIEQRSQLLVERGYDEEAQPVMSFSHLTFQEYLAACALKEAISYKTEAAVSAELIQNYEADPQWWEEVALLYAAQLDGAQREHFFQRLYTDRQKDRNL